MILDQPGKLLVGFQALPAKGIAPLVEGVEGPAGCPIVPELAEALYEQVGGVQALVGAEKQLQGLAAFRVQVLPARQEVVLLSLDELATRSRQPGVLLLANGIESLVQMPQDVELVEDDLCLRGMSGLERRGAKGLPHVDDGQTNSPGFLGPSQV